MSHNNGVVNTLSGELVYEYEDSFLDDNEGGVGPHPTPSKTIGDNDFCFLFLNLVSPLW
jgi:hypothetical protein